MKNSFWVSLFVFVLFMCSCKTHKSGCEMNFTTKESAKAELFKYQVLKDTFNVLRFEIDKSKLKIIETINITEYDAESGKPTKETNAKREITQDSDKVVAEEENQVVTDCSGLEVEQFRDLTKKVESEVSEESVGGQESFGKWFGIGIACVIGIIVVFLLVKKL